MKHKGLFKSVPFIMLLITSCSGLRERERVVDEVYIHKYGVTVPVRDWKERGKHGQVVSQLDNGVTVKRNFVAGILEGEATYTFPHSGTIAKRETYSHGQIIAEKENYPCGNPKIQTQFDADGGKTVTSWYQDGTPKSLEQYENREGRLMKGEYFTSEHHLESEISDGAGKRICRDEYGQLLSHDTFEEGMLTLQTTYYQDGTPKEIIPYQNGSIQGERRTFLPSGEPLAVELWEAGHREGMAQIFLNGRKSAEVPYQNNKKHGIEKHYSEDGEVTQEISWKGGRRHGPSYTYLGNTTKVEWFKENLRVSENQYQSR